MTMMKTVLMLLVAIWIKPGTPISDTCPFTQFGEVGHDVTLRCCFNFSLAHQSFGWERNGTMVHAYRSGKDLVPQDKQFKNRTTLIQNDLERGVTAVQIFSVQPNDSGIYCCTVTEGPGLEVPSKCVRLIVRNATEFRPDTTSSPVEDEMTKSVRNATEFRPNTSRSPEKDETTKSEVKNTDVIAWVSLVGAVLVGAVLVVAVLVGAVLVGAGLVGTGPLRVLLKWRKSCWRKLRENPAVEDANIYEMETLNPSAVGGQNQNIGNDLGHIEQQVN